MRLGLNAYQAQRFQNQLGKIEQHREKVLNRIRNMEQEMNRGELDRIRQRNHLREIEKAMKKWQEQVRDMQKHMNAG